MMKLTNFRINGLFGREDISLCTETSCLILVGPNGIGKSTVTSIFYLFVSKQWERLLEYDFRSLEIKTLNDTIVVLKGELVGLVKFENFMKGPFSRSRLAPVLQKILNNNLINEILQPRPLQVKEARKYTDILGVSVDELRELRFTLMRRFMEDDIAYGIDPEKQKKLEEVCSHRVVYLPTFRKIEKDLKEIIVDFEERLRVSSRDMFVAGRSGPNYLELVSFGMEDVKRTLEKLTRELRDFVLNQYNDLSANYLRTVIRRGNKFTVKQITSITGEQISAILARVSSQILKPDDNELLRDRIMEFKERAKKSDFNEHDQYLASYITLLLELNEEISHKEDSLMRFIEVSNKYINPEKKMIYDEMNYKVKIEDSYGNNVDLSVLSSGEKQIVSIFSMLYLESVPGQFIVIDEPELSLSVPWQKNFLPDILNSGKCEFLLAVTHSPFIYDNELMEYSKDLRKLVHSQK